MMQQLQLFMNEKMNSFVRQFRMWTRQFSFFQSSNQRLVHHLLDRFLVVIESFQIQPVICLTKKDLANEKELEKVAIAESTTKKLVMKS